MASPGAGRALKLGQERKELVIFCLSHNAGSDFWFQTAAVVFALVEELATFPEGRQKKQQCYITLVIECVCAYTKLYTVKKKAQSTNHHLITTPQGFLRCVYTNMQVHPKPRATDTNAYFHPPPFPNPDSVHQ